MLSITVDTLVDVVDANDGRTSFREAIADAPAHGSAVDFHASLDGGTIELNSQLNISQTIQVIGPGADKLTIDARQTGRVFHVFSGVGMATISGLKITGGLQGPGGGGVLNEGSLKLLNVVVSGNQSTVHGGGVFSNGPYLEINSSAIENNRASWGGGVAGDLAGNEWIYILNSTIADNVADDPDSSNGQGAGVRVSVSSTSTIPNLEIHNSTISGNRSESQGGGVHLTGITRANIRNVTIVNNRADVHSGGIFNEAAPVLMRNSVLAGNTAGDAARADGSGSLSGQFNVTSRYNFVGADHSSFQLLAANSNILGPAPNPLDPKVSPLTNVGGLTRVHVPLPGSPIVDHGADGDASGLTGDQRGSSRFIEDSTTPNAPGNVSDIGPVELEARLAVGDFNGDGREDELRYSPALKSLLVAEKAATGAGWEVGAWGSLALATNPSPTSTNGIIVGDFNGDGRDDVMTLNSDYSWLIGISDGTLFHINKFKNGSGPFYAGWQYVYVGDFDADGDEEIIGKVNGGTNWTLVEYSPITGGTKATTVNLSGFTPGTQVFVQDVNRDGKDDFITRVNGSSPWKVNLSQGTSTGTLLFANAVEMNAWIGYGYTTATGELDADKAMAKVIEEFAWVYNNVELELYAGFMKGLQATAETKAANPWEQAGLLVQRLETAGFEADIASGNAQVPLSDLYAWLGIENATPEAKVVVFHIIRNALDGNAVAVDAASNVLSDDAIIIGAFAHSIRFRHAWVRVKAPTASGLQWIDVDPSWKFEDRQAGEAVNLSLPSGAYVPPTSGIGGRVERGTYDELAYLAGAGVNQLPIEWYEDQLTAYLASTGKNKSVSEIAYNGPIIRKSFTGLDGARGASQYGIGPITAYPNFTAIVSDPLWRDQLTHRMTVSMESGATNETATAVPLAPGYALPDYLGYEVTDATNVSMTSGVASYGKDIVTQNISFGSNIQPYLPSDGRLTDALGTRTSISNPTGLGHFGNPDFQYFRTSGPTDYAAAGLPAQDADGTYRFTMQRASAAQFELDPNYQFTSNTRIEFDVRQIYANPSHELTYDPILAVGYAVYDTSGNMIGQPSFALIDGRMPGESGTNSSVTPQASTAPAIWRRFSINVATPVTGQHRIFIIHADNEIIDYRKQHGPLDTTALAASGTTVVRRVRFREEGTGAVTVNPGGGPLPGLPFDVTLLGNSFKSQSISSHTITSETLLEFKFSSTQLGVAHYVGVDTDNDVDGSGAEALRPFAGTFAGLNISTAFRSYLNADLNSEKTIMIAIGAEFPHLIGQQISKLIIGSMDDGHSATSNFRSARFIEPADYQSTTVNGDLVLNGESYQSVDMSYMIGPDTIIEFDYESSQKHAVHSIGWDTDDNPATPTGTSNQRALIPIYGNDSTIVNPYYDGSGRDRIRIRVGDYFTGTTRLQMNNLVFGQTGGNSRYGNVRLYESRSDVLTVGSTDVIRLSGNVFQRLPLEYNITPRTYLEFDFKIVAAGGFAGIGWDRNSTFNNSYSNEALYRLISSYDDPYSTAINLPLNVGSVGQKTTVRIPIGAQLSGQASQFMQNLVFVNDGGKVEYSNFKLGERTPSDSSLFQQDFVIANPQSGYSTDSIQIGYDDMGGSYSGRSYVPFLEINGTRTRTGSQLSPLFTGEAAKIKTEHWHPTLLATAAQLPNLNVAEEYERQAGQVHAIVVDANQFSRDYLAAQQTLLNLKQGPMLQNRLGSGSPSRTEAIDVIGDLLSYTGAKYWYDFNTYNASIDGYMHAIGLQPRVGSGLISSDSTLITNQSVTHLNFPNVPSGMGVDLPNVAHMSFDGTGSSFGLSLETLQLIGQNSSALENAVIEEVINDSSVSTMRGLSRAFDGEFGLTAGGAQVADAVQVFESVLANGVRTIYFRGEIGVNADPTRLYSPTRNDARTWNQLLNATAGELRNHVRPGQVATNPNSQAYAMADILANYVRNAAGQPITGNAVGTIRLLVPRARTKMGSWSGTVYVAESQTLGGWSGDYKIAPDTGPESNGAYGLGQLRPQNTSLYQGAFRNNTYAGDPVNVANGSMFRDETDVVFANLGVPLNFSRHYDTQSKEDFGMGGGWMYSFGDLLYKDSLASNDITWLDSGGVRHLFKWDAGTSRFTLPNDLEGVLKFVNAGVESDTGAASGWTELRFKSTDGLEYHFGAITTTESGKTVVGRLSKILDRNGDGVTIVYGDALRKIQTVSDVNDASRKLTFVYNANGITMVTRGATTNDPSTPTWTYSIAPATSVLPRRLLSVTTPVVAWVSPATNPTAVEQSTAQTTAYAYYEENLPWRGLIKKITERDGSWHEYEYYSNGRAFRVKQGQFGQPADHSDVAIQTFNYNLFRNLTEFTNERRNFETYIHQDNGLVERQIHADRSQVRYEWGVRPNNVLIPETEFLMTSSTDERGGREQFEYYVPGDSGYRVRGQLKKSTGKDGLVTDFTYWNSYAANFNHLSDLFTSVTINPDGVDPTTTLTRETSGRGRLVASSDAENNVVEYAYYPNDDVVTPGNGVYRRGLLRSIKQPAILDSNDPNDVATVTYETIFDYDPAGNVKSTIVRNAATLAAVALTQFVHDSLGNVVQSIDSTSVVTESVYDVLGRLRETGFADANVVIDPYDAFTSKFKYDALGRVRESTDPLGRVTRFEYDRQGHILKQINPDGTELRHEYDAFGNRVATTDALKRTTRFVYDNRNRLIQTIMPGGAVERLRYDGAGNVVAKIDALGNATTFKYDASGRLLETKLPDPDGPSDDDGDGLNLTSPTTTNKYDKLGNLVETIDPEANVTQFKYDKLGRVVQTQTLKSVNGDRNATTPWVVTGTLQSLTTIDYDAVGNVIETAAYDVSLYDPGSTLTLLADPRDEQDLAPSKVQVVSIRYDAFGRPVKTINADGTSTRTEYDAAGRVRFQYDEANSVTEFIYDAFGRLEKTKLPNPTTGTITPASPTTTYQYDAVGNRIAVTDARGYTTRFEYDVFNRLIAATDPLGGRSRSAFDVAGQLIATVDELGRATYSRFDERGQVVLALSADPDGAGPKLPAATRSLHDDAGRLVEQTDPRGYATAYVYDRLGRLTIERSIESVVVDDFNGTNSSVFTFDGASQQNSWLNAAAIGGDTTTIDGSAHSWQPYAQWAFPQMPAGNYRVAFTWAQTGNVSYASAGIAINSFSGPNAQARFYGGINQSQLPNDFYRDHAGSITAWEDVKFGNDQYYPISQAQASAGSTILVNLIGTVGGTLQADAVRLERIVEKKFQYDANGNVTQSTDELRRVSDYQFDELDRPTIVQLPLPGNSGVNGAPLPRPKTTTAYDGYGNVKSVVEYRNFGVGGANQRKTAYEYDARNRRTAEILDAGVDGTNGVTDYVNQRTVYHYDAVGNLEYKREYAENAAAVGGYDLLRTTAYKYDKLGRLARETLNSDGNDSSPLPTEQITLTTYDAAGNVQNRTETAEIAGGAAALTTTYVYDALNRVTSETAAGSSQSRRTRYQYDAIGNLTSEIDALGRLSRSEYDRLGRLVKSVGPDPDGKAAQVAESTSFAYDAVGNLVAQTNGAGETERSAYDSHGLLVWSQDGRGDETIRRYDAVGNLVRLVDPAGNLATYAYDGLDRLTTETTASGAVRTREYNSLEQLAYATDRNGRATRYNYDRLDRKIEERWYADRTSAGNNQGLRDQLLWFYDDLGRLREDRLIHNTPAGAFDYRITRSYQYDGLDRLTETSNQSLLNNPSQRSATASGAPTPEIRQTYAYAYDASGQTVAREQFIAPPAGVIQFAARTKSTYNAFGELVRQEDQEVSAAGVASTILDFESTDAVFSYLGDGSLASTTRYTDWDAGLNGHRNRVVTNYAYDGAGRLTSIEHGQARRSTASWPVNTELVEFDYGYDDAGRIDSIGTDWNTALTPFFSRTDYTQAFDYDDAGQLTGVMTGSVINGSYTYTANGNRNSAKEPGYPTVSFTPEAQNRVSQDTAYSYAYDAEGNLTHVYLGTDPQTRLLWETYAWDHRNRLTKFEQYYVGEFIYVGTVTSTTSFRYNAANELVYGSSGQGGSGVHYLVENGQRTMTFGQNGAVGHRIQYGPTGDVLFDQSFSFGAPLLQTEQNLQMLLGDHQHSTRIIVSHDASDAAYVEQSVTYTPFGQLLDLVYEDGGVPFDSGAVNSSFGFQGMLYDVGGNYRTAARVYDPRMGRFISEDPIQDGSNWYMFAGNDPINSADPSGLSQQGHPFNRLPASTTFGGFVGAGLGTSILSGGLGGGSSLPSVGSIASYQAAAPRINQSELATYGGQVTSYRAQQASINAQLAAAKGSLANRSFYEVYDKSADRARIDALTNQLVDVNGRLSAARSNYTQVLNGWEGQRSTYAGYQHESVGAAFGSGLQTGGKAVGNSFASAGTLGFYEGPFGVTQRDLDNGYATSRLIAGASSELLTGVLTGGAASLASKAGRGARIISKSALAFDAAGNTVGLGRGAVDAYQNGLSVGSGVQIVGGALGISGNYLGAAQRSAARSVALDDVVGSIGHNADVATELARRAAARGRITNSPQAFGTRAHVYFERLNGRLNRNLVDQGSSFRVVSEEFRDAAGRVVNTRAKGSIGADAIIRNTSDMSINRVFDLKTYGSIQTPISLSRQSQFNSRFGTPAQEIYRQR